MLRIMVYDRRIVVENIKEKSVGSNYKLIDLLKFICAFLVIGIHTRPFQASNMALDKLFYYDVSNYAVPFFYACTGYFMIALVYIIRIYFHTPPKSKNKSE